MCIGAIGFVLFLLKNACARFEARLEAAKTKKRKGKRKRQEDIVNEDGMGL